MFFIFLKAIRKTNFQTTQEKFQNSKKKKFSIFFFDVEMTVAESRLLQKGALGVFSQNEKTRFL